MRSGRFVASLVEEICLPSAPLGGYLAFVRYRCSYPAPLLRRCYWNDEGLRLRIPIEDSMDVCFLRSFRGVVQVTTAGVLTERLPTLLLATCAQMVEERVQEAISACLSGNLAARPWCASAR